MTDKSDAKVSNKDLLEMTTEIVASYLGKNEVKGPAIPDIIKTVHSSLSGLGNNSGHFPVPMKPAVPIKKSVQPEYIVCLEDGRKLKMLKRHLRTAYNMTPEQYREKWRLPPDYPMTAPNYAKQRSRLAKKIGLGKKGNRARKQQ